MRIVQLIDSLETGGAEKMAVSYANALSAEISFSGLIATRKEGALKKELQSDVPYWFANRKSALDFKALWRTRTFVKEHKVSIMHAHSSSFFFAVLLKMIQPSLKIVWHDHYGYSDFVSERKNKRLLQWASFFFYRIIAVNEKLKNWSKKELHCKQVKYLPNFVSVVHSESGIPLQGADGKRILCLANLRPQKNHLLVLEIAKNIKNIHPDWTFHLVGKDFKDAYSEQLREQILALGLQHTVFLYGSVAEVDFVIRQSDIGILTSISEGLPVSLLEYGYFGLPVVATAVGEIPTVISGANGILIPEGDAGSFTEALLQLIADPVNRKQIGTALQNDIKQHYIKESVVQDYLNFISNGE
ncbi:glycosyltransferase family 4 protein [Flavobacterium sp.]|uniref:glycosyltransferase family 4 protein n=1 Tax=Flavobacterium sp. TaxID=239 RepID=UPI002637EC2F|nr:glycosyltransferase family 4 protein [Flavobacterium sp.]